MKKLSFIFIMVLLFSTIQAQVAKTINVTAGKLYTSLTEQERITITSLTLTGTIDARDFRTMRDNMPLLAEIDLSGTTVTAYSGSEGTTYSTKSIPYLQNAIPEAAFNKKITLKYFILPSTANDIQQYAFYGCNNLTSVNIPSSVTNIGFAAFYFCSELTSIDIPSGVHTIENSCFGNCSSLTEIIIPSLVTSIGSGAFAGCSHLTSINLPSSIVSIGGDAFGGCQKLTSITLPQLITNIEDNTFENCFGLTSVIIPPMVTTIGFGAFSNCTGLTSITIPSTVTKIENCAFASCYNLTSFTIGCRIPPVISLGNQCTFQDIDKSNCILYIPYGTSSFYASPNGWKDFTNKVEPSNGFYLSSDTVKVGGVAGSSSSVAIVANIDWKASSDQSWLTVSPANGTGPQILQFTAQVNESITKRRATVRVTSTGLETISVPVIQYGSTVTLNLTPGSLASALNQEQLNTITNLTLIGTIDARDFKIMRDKMPLLAVLDISGVTIAAYNGIEGTSISSNTDYPASTIPQNAFSYNSYQGKGSLMTIQLPSSVTSLGSHAFEFCTGLSAISIPSSVTDMGSYAFSGCKGIKSIMIPSSVTNTGNSTFMGCTCLTSVNLPSSIITIGASSFSNCKGLTSVTIPSSVTYIESYAFSGCNILTSVDLPASIVTIGSGVFQSSGLKSISFPPLVTSISRYVFSKCNGLTSVIIPSSITFVDELAFLECKNLVSVSILSSKAILANRAFANCDNIRSLTVPWTVPPVLQDYTFCYFDRSLCTLYAPFGTKKLYAADERWKSFTNIVEPSVNLYLTPVRDIVALPNNASSAGVDISANVEWTAVSDQSWLTVNPASGTGNQTITFTAGANSSVAKRSAIVTLSSKSLSSQTIAVTQDGINVVINVSSGSLASIFTQDELNSISSLTLSGSMDARDFKVIRDQMPMLNELDLQAVNIAEYNGLEGTGNYAGSHNYPANRIPDQGFNKSGAPMPLTSLVLPYSITSFGYDVFEYELNSMTAPFPVPISFNTDSGPFGYLNTRSCILHVPYGTAVIYKSANAWKSFSNIVEASQGFNLSSYSLYLTGAEGSSTNSQITSNVEWTVNSDQDWLTVSPLAGNGIQTLTFTAKANPLFATRIGHVTISGGGISQTVSVKQEIQPQPLKIVEVTSGNLATVLTTDELNTLSKLTLTGTIDARDFKTMRDRMPYLAELDLSAVTIEAYSGTEGPILATVKDYPANTIPQSAFLNGGQGKTSLTSVILPLSITCIGNYSFHNCTGLTGIFIPPKVTTIEQVAFYYCQSLATVKIPPSVTTIGWGAFGQCKSLQEVDIPSSVTSLGNLAFELCTGLKTVTVWWSIPLNLNTTDGVFYMVNKSACNLKIPYGTTSLYASAPEWKYFTNVTEMHGFHLSETSVKVAPEVGNATFVEINSDVAWTAQSDQSWLTLSPTGATGNGQKLSITAEVNELHASRKATVTISSPGMESQTIAVTQLPPPLYLTVTAGNLGSAMNADQAQTTTHLILKGTIDARDFRLMRDRMPLLTSLDLSEVKIVAYYGYEGTYSYQSTTYWPDVIPPYAFVSEYNNQESRARLTSVILPNSLVATGNNSFMYCNGITKIIIPPSVNTISNHSFYDCQALTNVVVPSSVRSIMYLAFANCKALASITIPSSVTSIDDNAFYNCSNIKSLTVGWSKPLALYNNIFGNLDKTSCTLYVPYGSASLYASANIWKDFTNIIELPGFYFSASTITLDAEPGNSATVDISSNVAYTVQSDQSWLTVSPDRGSGVGQKITFTAEVNSLLTIRTAKVTVSSTGLESKLITVIQSAPLKVLALTPGSLSNALTVEELNSVSKLTLSGTIDAHDFKTMRDKMPLLSQLDLSAVTIVSYTGTMGTSIWGNYTYPENTIPEAAFYNGYQGKSTLTSITLPENLTIIARYAFALCTGINTISIPPKVNTLGRWAFFKCINLQSALLLSTSMDINSYSFFECSHLTSITVNCPIPPDLSNQEFVFNLVDKINCRLNVPFGASGLYSTSNQWKDFFNISELEPIVRAIAGPDQFVYIGTIVTLDASGSKQIDHKALTYQWTAPASITLSSETAVNPTFTAPEVESDTDYIFSLQVSDGVLTSYADQVVITVKKVNSAPIAHPGMDKAVNENSFVTLDGSASLDPENNAITFAWVAPEGITLSSSSDMSPMFKAPEVAKDTVLTFYLTVSDGLLSSPQSRVVITVKKVNQAPIANAGNVLYSAEGAIVTLNATLSTDPDGDALTYLWTAPAGITLSSPTASMPTFTAPAVQSDTWLTFTFVVSDGQLNSSPSEVKVLIKQIDPILGLISKADFLSNPVAVKYRLFKKVDNSFLQQIDTLSTTGDSIFIHLEPGEWMVLVSSEDNPSDFVSTYAGDVSNWNEAEIITVPDRTTVVKVINCIMPPTVHTGIGRIAGFVNEKPGDGTKSISIIREESKATGVPVQTALVQLYKKGSAIPVASVLTDDQGAYLFDKLEISDYEIVVEIPGYVQSERFPVALSNTAPATKIWFAVNTSLKVITDNNTVQLSMVKAYPNPTEGMVTISGLNGKTTIAVYAMDGKLILKKETSQPDEAVDLTSQVPGTYIFVINEQRFKVNKK